MVVEYSEYKGHKLIVLKRETDSKFPFSFGKNKAKLIVENFEAVKAFAEEEDEAKKE
jgi:hypothetical protein